MRVEGIRHWLHVVSDNKYTFYLVHSKRGSEAMDFMGILPQYRGSQIRILI
jgi:transposase